MGGASSVNVEDIDDPRLPPKPGAGVPIVASFEVPISVRCVWYRESIIAILSLISLERLIGSREVEEADSQLHSEEVPSTRSQNAKEGKQTKLGEKKTTEREESNPASNTAFSAAQATSCSAHSSQPTASQHSTFINDNSRATHPQPAAQRAASSRFGAPAQFLRDTIFSWRPCSPSICPQSLEPPLRALTQMTSPHSLSPLCLFSSLDS